MAGTRLVAIMTTIVMGVPVEFKIKTPEGIVEKFVINSDEVHSMLSEVSGGLSSSSTCAVPAANMSADDWYELFHAMQAYKLLQQHTTEPEPTMQDKTEPTMQDKPTMQDTPTMQDKPTGHDHRGGSGTLDLLALD